MTSHLCNWESSKDDWKKKDTLHQMEESGNEWAHSDAPTVHQDELLMLGKKKLKHH